MGVCECECVQGAMLLLKKGVRLLALPVTHEARNRPGAGPPCGPHTIPEDQPPPKHHHPHHHDDGLLVFCEGFLADVGVERVQPPQAARLAVAAPKRVAHGGPARRAEPRDQRRQTLILLW
jgi:hypothetical protein